MVKAYIGIGSNIDPVKNLPQAARILQNNFPGIRFSSVYKTAPQDVSDQPDFLNAAAVFETGLTPEDLVRDLKNIEKSMAKNTPYPYGPRTIDLDLLLYGESVLPGKDEWLKKNQINLKPQKLFVPHLKLHLRRFVLEPLIELAGTAAIHPALSRSFGEFFINVTDQRCEKTVIKLP